MKKDIFSKPDDVLTAAEKYIEEHGPQAFERLLAKVNLYLVFHIPSNLFIMVLFCQECFIVLEIT